jgi:circadian clock protein KaiC
VAGGAGSGKTLLATEFIVKGALEYGDPGVFVSFEEPSADLSQNVASLGYDLDDLQKRGLLVVDYVRVERSEIEETGEYDLEGLFIRLGYAIDSIKAKRVVLDTLESLFAGLQNASILRAELRRLFGWLKSKGVTAVITGERGEASLTRQGLEEYVSDCVIVLDHRVTEQITTRRLRVVKYRGSPHGANEYPFLIDEDGITVVPITDLSLQHEASEKRISSGVPDLDRMLSGGGFYRGTSILVSGTAGTGKTSLAASFAVETCERSERCLYVSLEESEAQVARNMRSIGIDLGRWIRKGTLRFHPVRPSSLGLEMHLASLTKIVNEFRPTAIVIDPISSFLAAGTIADVTAMAMRLVDQLKQHQITAMFTSLTHGGSALEQSDVGISSVMDAWLLLRDLETDAERNRGIFVLKARGMAHSNQVREFRLTSHGIELVDVLIGPDGVLVGSARDRYAANERAQARVGQPGLEHRRRALDTQRSAVAAQIAALQAQLDAAAADFAHDLEQTQRQSDAAAAGLGRLSAARTAGHPGDQDGREGRRSRGNRGRR